MQLSVPIHQLKQLARQLAQREGIPHCDALNRVAADQGFASWSLLVSHCGPNSSVAAFLRRLDDGDLFVIGARPGHGKTMFGLRLLLAAARSGRKSFFFTLEYTDSVARRMIDSLGDVPKGCKPEILTAEEISSDYVMECMAAAPQRTLALIDYLQVLDQQRTKPHLSDQLCTLQRFARAKAHTIGFVSQIDRRFDEGAKRVPDFADIRLPNPIPAGSFAQGCFIHGERTQFVPRSAVT